jgi:hypothetical protein
MIIFNFIKNSYFFDKAREAERRKENVPKLMKERRRTTSQEKVTSIFATSYNLVIHLAS